MITKQFILKKLEKAKKIFKLNRSLDSFLGKLRVFVYGLLFLCALIDVPEYQKVTIGKYTIEKFPRHIVIETFFADTCNEIFGFYIRHRNVKPKPYAIPLKIEFKSLI
jgi:hypothetical protein